MSQIVPSFEPRLLELEKELSQVNSPTQAVQKLLQIRDVLNSVEPQDVYSSKDLMVNHLKPISRDLTNLNMRDLQQQHKDIQSIMQTLIKLYIQAATTRFEVLAFELLLQLLDRSTPIFKKSAKQQNNQLNTGLSDTQQEMSFNWVGMKNAELEIHTTFYYKCIEQIMVGLEGIEASLRTGGLNYAKQLLNFLTKMALNLRQSKLTSLCERIALALEDMMISPAGSKDSVKQLSTDSIKGVSDAGAKLANICMKNEVKRRYEMLVSIYGLGMLGSNSIERKINGLKIINKESESFYRSGASFIKEEEYVTWLYDNKIVDLILQQSSQSPILKHCAYILRIVFKRRCLNIANLGRILDSLETMNTENRQIVLRNLDLESIRLEYSDYEMIISKLKIPRKADFYQEDLFSICSQCIRYSTNNLLKMFISSLGAILSNNAGKFRQEKIQHKCMKTYVKAIVRLLDKDNDSENKKKDLQEIYDSYFEKEFTQLGVLIFKNIFEELPQTSELSKSKTATFIISSKNIVEKGLQAIKEGKDPLLQQSIQQLLCLLLKHASDVYGSEKVQFKSQIFLLSVQTPRMFDKLASFVNYNSQQLLETFEKLLTKFQTQKIAFECIRSLFFRVNFIYIREVKEYNQEHYFQVQGKISSLKGVDSLKYLLLNASNAENRSQIASFIADLYTSIPESRIVQGEQQLEIFLKETLQMTLAQQNSKESQERLLGYLALIESLMLNTEALGVGKYRPHNSLVPISTVQIKIMNDLTYGNDVAQSYWKKVSSNLTLFDLLVELGDKFKCSSCEISLQEGENYWPEKWNGLTLEELKIDDKLLKAVKTSKQKIRKERLIDQGELTPKAKKAFEEIYKMFAVDGKMSKKQCSNFVAAVTKTTSSIHDGRVVQFFKEHDLDQDDNLTLEDFFRFYKQHCIPQRDDIVWKNLSNMRFRKDLKKYDDPIEITNQNVLYRAILYGSHQFYELLFLHSSSPSKQLEERCRRLLLRLPTFPKTLQSLKSELDLISKNSFQTEYLLIAIKSKLNSSELALEEREYNKLSFMESGNSVQIFEMMIRIDSLPNVTQDSVKCLFISLQILRSLVRVPDLRSNIEGGGCELDVVLKIPSTYLFLKLAQGALKSMDIDILEAALVLQMTQPESGVQFALQGIFHQEVGIRRICCNYLFVLYLQGRIEVDPFQVEQKVNCEYWFETLSKICLLNRDIDYAKVIKQSLAILATRAETIESNPDDPIIFGNLSIICSIVVQRGKNYEDISPQVAQISKHVLSVRSRKLIYTILAHFDLQYAIAFINSLIDGVQHLKEVQPKKFYVGLKNLGSTCYINSVLQVLFCVDQFKNLVLSLPKHDEQQSEVQGKKIVDNSLYQLQKMYAYLMHSTRKYYNPEQFCLTIKRADGQGPIDPKVQEDAHEFVGKFLDKLQKQVQKTDKIDAFRQLFEGNTVTQVLCKRCSNKINREQKFIQISLAVQNLQSLEQSFQKYILPQEIEDYYCSSCSQKVEKIERSTFLNKLPQLLTINLQRIIYELQDFQFKKIDSKFSFPENLNVKDYMVDESNLTAEECEYRLKAVIVHSGTSKSGHYYSFVRVGEEWYKFNDQTVTRMELKDIPHECFGGSDSKEQWGDDLKFSTNAYILFYERKALGQKGGLKAQQDELLVKAIGEQNGKFYQQLQIHQQSVFIFASQLFAQYAPKDLEQRMKYAAYEQNWNQEQNVIQFQLIYSLCQKLLEFSTTFYDVKPDYIFKIGEILFRLFFLLPEKSYSFLTSINPDTYIENLCLHPDDNIRNIHKYMLNKSIHVFTGYYQASLETEEEGVAKLLGLIDCLFAFLEDERLTKNINKLQAYFEFWKVNCQFVPDIVTYLAEKETLAILGHLLLASSSPLRDPKDKKPVEVPQYCVLPIAQTMVFLMSRKKNLQNQLDPKRVFPNTKYYQMTEKQKMVLGNTGLYTKMMSTRFDNGVLALVAGRLCENDSAFSEQMAPILLRGLNNISHSDSGSVILAYIRSYLSIEDACSQSRLEWVLGIPQLRMGDELVYGLTYEDESVAFEYVSPLHFGKMDKQDHKTALTILYENHSTFNSFSVEGVMLLLNLMCTVQGVYSYIMSLPAPTYLYRSYLDWIQKFITSFKDSYVMEEIATEKANRVSAMLEMFNYLVTKVKSEGLELPVNKKIIGRNKDLYAIESVYNEEYKMSLWAHLTYILPNLPTAQANQSLPRQLFKFNNPTGYAPLFISISKSEMVEEPQEMGSQLTTYTLEVEAKRAVKLKFNLSQFKHEIYAQKGKVFVNFPYLHQDEENMQGKISKIVQISFPKNQQPEEAKVAQSKEMETTHKDSMDYYDEYSLQSENVCKYCTFINKPGEKFCDVCLVALY